MRGGLHFRRQVQSWLWRKATLWNMTPRNSLIKVNITPSGSWKYRYLDSSLLIGFPWLTRPYLSDKRDRKNPRFFWPRASRTRLPTFNLTLKAHWGCLDTQLCCSDFSWLKINAKFKLGNVKFFLPDWISDFRSIPKQYSTNIIWCNVSPLAVQIYIFSWYKCINEALLIELID